MMNTVLTNQNSLTIPDAIIEKMQLKQGQRIQVSIVDDHIALTPKAITQPKGDYADIRGIFKGANPKNYRDRSDLSNFSE